MTVPVNALNNPELRDKLMTIMELASLDKVFRAHLLKNPEIVLGEAGITIPSGWKVAIREDEPGVFTIPIPPMKDLDPPLADAE